MDGYSLKHEGSYSRFKQLNGCRVDAFGTLVMLDKPLNNLNKKDICEPRLFTTKPNLQEVSLPDVIPSKFTSELNPCAETFVPGEDFPWQNSTAKLNWENGSFARTQGRISELAEIELERFRLFRRSFNNTMQPKQRGMECLSKDKRYHISKVEQRNDGLFCYFGDEGYHFRASKALCAVLKSFYEATSFCITVKGVMFDTDGVAKRDFLVEILDREVFIPAKLPVWHNVQGEIFRLSGIVNFDELFDLCIGATVFLLPKKPTIGQAKAISNETKPTDIFKHIYLFKGFPYTIVFN
jgi:hypothetical protein